MFDVEYLGKITEDKTSEVIELIKSYYALLNLASESRLKGKENFVDYVFERDFSVAKLTTRCRCQQNIKIKGQKFPPKIRVSLMSKYSGIKENSQLTKPIFEIRIFELFSEGLAFQDCETKKIILGAEYLEKEKTRGDK
jgi:hypothetical protein